MNDNDYPKKTHADVHQHDSRTDGIEAALQHCYIVQLFRNWREPPQIGRPHHPAWGYEMIADLTHCNGTHIKKSGLAKPDTIQEKFWTGRMTVYENIRIPFAVEAVRPSIQATMFFGR